MTSIRSKLIACLVTVGCVVLATIGLRLSEDPDDFQVVMGSLGRPVTVNEGEVTVDDVRVGNALLENGAVTSTTKGMFVVVDVTVGAPGRDPLRITGSQLTSGDRTYSSYSELASVTTVPGFEATRDLVFEVDPQRIDDLTLDLWQSQLVSGYYQRVRVPLNITKAKADEVRTRARAPIDDLQLNATSRVMQ